MAEPNLIGGLAGGALIGFAAVLLLGLNGRIAGISGILNGLMTSANNAERLWRVAFIVGLIAGASVYRLLSGALSIQLLSGPLMLVAAGVLVGFGTKLGSGCTSGHGVCGLARLSPRSVLATIVFMGFGIATVYIVRHLS